VPRVGVGRGVCGRRVLSGMAGRRLEAVVYRRGRAAMETAGAVIAVQRMAIGIARVDEQVGGRFLGQTP